MFREVARVKFENAASGTSPIVLPVLYHAVRGNLFRVSIYIACTEEVTGVVSGAGASAYATDEYGNVQTVTASAYVSTTTPTNGASTGLLKAASGTDITYNIGISNQWLVILPQPFYFSAFFVLEEATDEFTAV